MTNEIPSPYSEKKDKGHDQLIEDLGKMYADAKNYDYHDFKSSLAAPKILLLSEIDKIVARIKNGWYDN